jgi:hypothetical protein
MKRHARFLASVAFALSLGLIAGCSGPDPAGNGGQGGATTGTSAGGTGGSGAAGPGGSAGSGGSDPAIYPVSILCPQPPTSDERCGPAYDPEKPLPQDELEKALSEGLATFRFAGTDGACAGCHAPDGYDLAKIGYSDADIVRRALAHVDQQKADTLVAYVHALRQKYGMIELLHPAKYRPEQPAFEAFAEVTPGLEVTDPQAQDERDEAFMLALTGDLGLLWATEKIDSLEKAVKAREELLAIDLRTLRIGIPFDHLSEDGWHGEPHRSIFEWYPAMPSAPLAGKDAEWYGLADAYVADPTEENLWAFYEAIDGLTGCGYDLSNGADPLFYQRACDWMRLKFKSLQVFQHMLRHGHISYPNVFADQPPGTTAVSALDLAIARYPIWEAGDILRVSPLQRPAQTACFSQDNLPCTLLPPKIDATIHEDPTYEEARIKQGEVFQQSWFVMSWLRDPALLHESHNFATFIGDYLESVLLPHYDVHHAFIVARMAAEKSASTAWLNAPGFRAGTGKIASVRTFSFKQIRNNFSPPPEDDPRRATHDRMFANFARMWIHLVEDDLQKTNEIFDRPEVLRAVRFMRTWVAELEGAEDPAVNALVLSIEALAPGATELRTAENIAENPGTGLQPTGTWGELDAPYTGN